MFWKKIRIGQDNECWLWTGSLTSWGYGDCHYGGRRTNASRIAYIITYGEIPEGFVVCHSCDTPACCNPKHLWVGTQADNLRDCRVKGRARYLTGAMHHRSTAKLTPELVQQSKALYASGISQTRIALLFGVHSSTISRAVRGDKWSHLTSSDNALETP